MFAVVFFYFVLFFSSVRLVSFHSISVAYSYRWALNMSFCFLRALFSKNVACICVECFYCLILAFYPLFVCQILLTYYLGTSYMPTLVFFSFCYPMSTSQSQFIHTICHANAAYIQNYKTIKMKTHQYKNESFKFLLKLPPTSCLERFFN